MERIFVVDRIEETIVVLEEHENGNIYEVNIEKLPEGIKEGTVLKYVNQEFIIDKDLQDKIEKSIEEKMKNLWND